VLDFWCVLGFWEFCGILCFCGSLVFRVGLVYLVILLVFECFGVDVIQSLMFGFAIGFVAGFDVVCFEFLGFWVVLWYFGGFGGCVYLVFFGIFVRFGVGIIQILGCFLGVVDFGGCGLVCFVGLWECGICLFPTVFRGNFDVLGVFWCVLGCFGILRVVFACFVEFRGVWGWYNTVFVCFWCAMCVGV